MQCEICNENTATMHFKQVTNGEVREMHICEECAGEHGFEIPAPVSMTDFLFGIGVHKNAEIEGEDRTCRSCGKKRSDLRKTSLLGCPECYETFKEEMEPMLAAMHKGTRHVGKVPAAKRVTAEILRAQAALCQAVEDQNFEEAAKLRDDIQALKGEGNGC